MSPIPKFNLYKRGNTYFYDAFINGKRVRETTGCTLKADAENYTKNLLSGKPQESHKADTSSCLSVLFDKAQRTAWRNHKSASTYDTNSKNVIKILGDISIHEVDSDALQRLSDSLIKQEKSVATINRHMALLSSLFTVAARQWGMNVKKPIFTLHKERNARTRLLSRAEEIKLIGEAPSPIRELVIVLLDTGMRLGEIVGLQSSMVDWETNSLRIPTSKNDEPRTVPMTKRVQQIIREWGGQCPLTKDQAEHKWKTVRENLGLNNVVLHTMRHTCATRLIEAGVPIFTVKNWLGHESIETTMRYAKLTRTQLDSAVELMEKAHAVVHRFSVVECDKTVPKL